MSRKLTIHLLGLKGVPATYGGVEHVVEEVGARLAGRGHRVVIHCRDYYTPASLQTHRGMELRRGRTIRTKRLDTISHTLFALLAATRERPDVIGLHNYPNGPLATLGRLAGIPVVLHLHGFEWGLGKWNRFDKALLRGMLRPATWAPAALTSVSAAQAEFVRDATRREVRHIPNGVAPPRWVEEGGSPDSLLAGLGLGADRYLLCVSRLVPQKGVEHLIRAYRSSSLELPLVIVGDHNHASDYVAALTREAQGDPRIRFLGYRFGEELWGLYAGCRIFILPSESEGMPLVLLEAMAAGCPILASDLREIRDVGASTIEYFRSRDPDDLRDRIAALIEDSARLRGYREAARARVRDCYGWDRIASAYEEVYAEAAARGGNGRRPVSSSRG